MFTMSSRAGGPCAQWDSYASRALYHPAFQPFNWRVMFDTLATYICGCKGSSMAMRSFVTGCSEATARLQQQFCDEALIRTANEGRFRPSIVISVFVGWKVSVTSFEVGARVFSILSRGSVVASDHAGSSEDGYGNDAHRVEFRFMDANNRVDLKCGRMSVPGTWLSAPISGPALINTIQACRKQRARVEGPDHLQQFAQLSAVLAQQLADTFAHSRAQGPLKYLQELEQFRSECPGLPFGWQPIGLFTRRFAMREFPRTPDKRLRGGKKKHRLQTPSKEEEAKKVAKEDPSKFEARQPDPREGMEAPTACGQEGAGLSPWPLLQLVARLRFRW